MKLDGKRAHHRMSTRHILIVDDKPTVAFFLSKTLERSNQDFYVSVAHSGEEALEVFNGSPVDLLVTDLRMPGISGLELIRRVQAFSPQTRAILITAYGNDEVEAEAYRLQTYRYITKPFDVGDFTQMVHEALCDAKPSPLVPAQRQTGKSAPLQQTGKSAPLALPNESFTAITQNLEDLRRDVGAQCIFLADMSGRRLAEAGITTGLDTLTLLSLLAGGFATAGALARQVGDGQTASLNFHAGSRYEIYSTNVGDSLFLAMVYDRQVQASRIGIVWVYTRRAIQRLPAILTAPGLPVE